MYRMFLSHASEDKDVAHCLKTAIESSFPEKIEVFCSSEDVPLGSRWLDVIDEALKQARLFLVVCSPESVKKPWINFESGCGWGRRVPVVPVCHSGLTVGALPQPLSFLQGLLFEDSSFLREIIRGVGRAIGDDEMTEPDPEAVLSHIEFRSRFVKRDKQLIVLRYELEQFLKRNPGNDKAMKLLASIGGSIGESKWGI